MELKSEYLCTLVVELGEAQVIGDGPHGVRRIVPLIGGKIEGPKINGEVLPFGADWVLIRPDGAIQLDVRATIRLDDGELVYVGYKGLFDPPRDYFRITPFFETGSEKYSWLNKIICVGMGTRGEGKVEYEIHQIL
jgi:hypothetical protein